RCNLHVEHSQPWSAAARRRFLSFFLSQRQTPFAMTKEKRKKAASSRRTPRLPSLDLADLNDSCLPAFLIACVDSESPAGSGYSGIVGRLFRIYLMFRLPLGRGLRYLDDCPGAY